MRRKTVRLAYFNTFQSLTITRAVINNYEQALVFLGADQTTEDAHIQALFTVKVGHV